MPGFQSGPRQMGNPLPYQEEVTPLFSQALQDALLAQQSQAQVSPAAQAQQLADVYRQNARQPVAYGSQQGPTSMLSDKGLQFRPMDHSAFYGSVAADNRNLGGAIHSGVEAQGAAGRNLGALLGAGVTSDVGRLNAATSRYNTDQTVAASRERTGVEKLLGEQQNANVKAATDARREIEILNLRQMQHQFDNMSAADKARLAHQRREIDVKLKALELERDRFVQSGEQFREKLALESMLGQGHLKNESQRVELARRIGDANITNDEKNFLLKELSTKRTLDQADRGLDQQATALENENRLAERKEDRLDQAYLRDTRQGDAAIDLNYLEQGLQPPAKPGEIPSERPYVPSTPSARPGSPGMVPSALDKALQERSWYEVFDKTVDSISDAFHAEPGMGLDSESPWYNRGLMRQQMRLKRADEAIKAVEARQGFPVTAAQAREIEGYLNSVGSQNELFGRALNNPKAPGHLQKILEQARQATGR